MEGLTNIMDKDKRVRKTMKHIKLVLNERRLAYAQAQELWKQQKRSGSLAISGATPEASATPP